MDGNSSCYSSSQYLVLSFFLIYLFYCVYSAVLLKYKQEGQFIDLEHELDISVKSPLSVDHRFPPVLSCCYQEVALRAWSLSGDVSWMTLVACYRTLINGMDSFPLDYCMCR